MGRPIERTRLHQPLGDAQTRQRRGGRSSDLSVDPDEPMARLPIESQQLLAFGKAQFIDEAKVILLDEITASLSRERKQMLLSLLRRLVAAIARPLLHADFAPCFGDHGVLRPRHRHARRDRRGDARRRENLGARTGRLDRRRRAGDEPRRRRARPGASDADHRCSA